MENNRNLDTKKERNKGLIAGVFFAFIVGFSFVGIKICVPIASTIEILVYRYNFALIGIFILMFFGRQKYNVKGKPKKDLMIAAGTYVAFMVFQAWGLIYANSIESAILFAIIPIISKIVARIIMKEKSTLIQNVFMCLSISALIYLIIKGASNIETNLSGLLILFLSSVCMGINNAWMRYLRKDFSPFEMASTITILGFCLFNMVYIIYLLSTTGLSNYFKPLESLDFILATAYLGIFCILFSAQLMGYMTARLETLQASIFGNLSTVVSIVAGVVILNETLMYYHVIAAVVVIISVVGISFFGRKNQNA